MRSAKTVLALLLCLLLTVPGVSAQDKQSHKPATEIAIVVEQDAVRFVAQKPFAEMRLQVFDKTGEPVFDSGVVTESELRWAMETGNGAPLKSGLYRYQLSLKEPGAETVHTRSGNFIVDRAVERDQKLDRVWITSAHDAELGSELIVARNEASTILGAANPSKMADTTITPHNADKTDTAKSKAEKAAAAGTAGRLAKFTTAAEVGDSVITEQNGNIGIGTTTPGTEFHLKGTGEVALRIEGDANSSAAQLETSIAGVRRWTFGSTGNNHPTPNAFYFYQDTNRSNSGISQTRMLINEDGNVGIGTTTPTARLHIEAATGYALFARNANPFGGTGIFGLTTTKGSGVLGRYDGPASTTDGWGVFGFTETGYAGVFGSGRQNGVFGATASNTDSGVFGKNDGGGWGVYGFSERGAGIQGVSNSHDGIIGISNATNKTGVIGLTSKGSNAVAGISSHKDGVGGYFQNSAGGVSLKVIGTADIGTLRITGADLAEPFAVAGADSIQPGTVMAIDPTQPGQLRVSTKAYDQKVAGVISGAGGINTGLTLKQPGTLADGAHPVALSGRVYCQVDASFGAIKPGDLLTTSSTPGYAMKVRNHARAQGAILGKALTGLKSGKGLVLVLVTLQ
ncbi:MAG: hypothetical protein JNJ50_01395 [Acidobacteria bacterium]|nr:hypothetical protein [Acidobacteriota bacterium]